ncbi:hypothetical protein [Actinomycetospora soli]|uniref:hypothetical protein n=1 Tax=Actinomycetospora soli TaxID=2893887 RepID=UPI001E42D554|nr:hypothetical protein [Actinomycetospora soli]MCD2185786.1 hypothetical protein [Actinomycetospora soli]
MGDVDGRVVLVVGGTREPGPTIIDALVAGGAGVELLDEDAEAARAARRRHGGPLSPVSYRPLAPEACAELVRRAVAAVVADRGVLDGIVTVGRAENEILTILKAAHAPLRASRHAAVVLVGDGTDQAPVLARWLGDEGVRVNAVSPDQDATDTAHAVRFLLSEAAEGVTGLQWPSADRDAALPRRPGPVPG